MQDKEIIDLFFERSEQAIEETKIKYGTTIRKIIFRFTGSQQDTEECENDTYLTTWNLIPPERPDPFAAFIYRVARNHAVNRFHSNTARKRDRSYNLVLDELSEIIPDKNGNPAAELEIKELTAAIERFLDTLNKEERYMFIRRYWFSDPVKEIAVQMHFPEHRVTVRLSRVRARLQKYLRKEGLISW